MGDVKCSGVEARSMAEHAILEKKPFVIIYLKDDKQCQTIFHMGKDNLSEKERAYNRKALDYCVMEATNKVNPLLKLAWLVQQQENQGGPDV